MIRGIGFSGFSTVTWQRFLKDMPNWTSIYLRESLRCCSLTVLWFNSHITFKIVLIVPKWWRDWNVMKNPLIGTVKLRSREKWSIACAYESTITGKDGTILLHFCGQSVQLNNLMRTFYRSLVKSIKVIVLILRLKFKTETYHISNRA